MNINNYSMDKIDGSSSHNSLKRLHEVYDDDDYDHDDDRNDDDDGPIEIPSKIVKTSQEEDFESNSYNQAPVSKKKKKKKKNNNKNRYKKTKGAQHPMANYNFGNFREYYGYRYPGQDEDKRVSLMKGEWFEGKDVLDIGCNAGEVSLEIAAKHNPKMVVGIDIDQELITSAKQILNERVKENPKLKNVHFFQENYVPNNDESLAVVRPEFDVILALSLTKWIHLNFGDEGLMRFFKKMFLHLKPGGLLVLEPQVWKSYEKKRHITKAHYQTYLTLELLPEQFEDYLMSDEVGFSESEELGISDNRVKGFQRPMYVFRKGSDL